MTERERVLAILHREQPDQLPWLADFAYLVDSMHKSGTFPPQYENTHLDDGLQKMHREWGTGFYLQGFEPFQKIPQGWMRNVEKEGDTTVTTITTPVGELREIQQYSHMSFSNGIVKHLVEDIEDLRIYLWMVQHTMYTADYTFAKERYETVGDNGVVLCYTPKSPLMDLVAIYAGVENVTYMLMDEEDEFTEILKALEEKYDEACRIVIDSPAECIMIPENISSECVVPFYERFMKGYHQKWTKAIRDAGKFSFVHQDGTVRGLVTELSKISGFDVIEAVTPMPVGDVVLSEVRSMVDENTIIWGGIPGGLFHEQSCTDQEFDDHVKMCIQVMTQCPRYVLGVADQVVPGSSEKRIRRVRELVDRYGKYR